MAVAADRNVPTRSRRCVLALVAGGAGAIALAACGASSAISSGAAPTAGAATAVPASPAAAPINSAPASTRQVALSTTSNAPTVKAAPSGTGQAVKITFANPTNATLQPVDTWCIDQFNKTYSGAQAEYLNPPAGSDWTQLLQTQIAADLAPDVYYTNTSLFLDFVSKQNYRPLDAYLAKDTELKLAPPANRQAFFDNLAQGISPQYPLGWSKLSAGITPILNTLWAGQIGAQDAVTRMQALLNPQLQAGQ